MDKVNVELAKGAEEVGLAVMLHHLVRQNMEQNPHKIRDFHKLNISFGLTVTDADVELTMEFSKGVLILRPGISPGAKVLIHAESDTIIAMSNLQIKWGMPYYFDETGREVLRAIFTKKMTVQGLLTHFPSMIRLSNVLSIN